MVFTGNVMLAWVGWMLAGLPSPYLALSLK